MEKKSIEYKHEYYHAGVNHMTTSVIPERLGYADASDEWIKDELTANSNFIHIDSYNKFADVESIFLVGRIGSGKTTMLNKLKYSIKKGDEKRYSSVIMLDTRDYIAQLGATLRMAASAENSFSEIEYIARSEWKKTIYIVVMEALFAKYGEKHPEDFKKIHKYLLQNGYISSNFSFEILDKICSKLSSINNEYIHDGAILANVMTKITTVGFEDAVGEMNNALQKYGNFLVLIDSIEKYEFDDTITLAVLNGLVNLCIDVARFNRNLLLKMAAPSELIPQLMSINPEKLSNKMVYIRWSHDDLKTFVAVRIYKYINNCSSKHIDSRIALEFFENYYDEYCTTRCNFKFPTFSYCLSYTLKEPRQLLSIYNAWLFFEEIYKNKNRMELVEKAITNDELDRIKGALSIYSSIHPKMFEMFKRTFNYRPYCFSEQEFDEWINACKNMREDLDAYDLKRFFISSGLVGTMIELHEISAEDKKLDPKRNIRIKEVIFEYQHKECLPFNSETKFCLHPMVFGALNIKVDRNTFVYPKPIEEDSEFIPW